MMGRSVETVSDAAATAYLSYESVTECWECAGEVIAGDEEEVCAVCEGTGEVPPSDEEEVWDEYVDALRSRVLDLFPSMTPENAWLGAYWRKQVTKKFLAEFTELALVGTGSNGISLYTAKEGA